MQAGGTVRWSADYILWGNVSIYALGRIHGLHCRMVAPELPSFEEVLQGRFTGGSSDVRESNS